MSESAARLDAGKVTASDSGNNTGDRGSAALRDEDAFAVQVWSCSWSQSKRKPTKQVNN